MMNIEHLMVASIILMIKLYVNLTMAIYTDIMNIGFIALWIHSLKNLSKLSNRPILLYIYSIRMIIDTNQSIDPTDVRLYDPFCSTLRMIIDADDLIDLIPLIYSKNDY